MHPKVTIQIPTYNQANYILKAVQSALMQDYKNLEIIIADDCSSDHTQEILKDYAQDSRIKYYKNNKNIGRVANYHKALNEYCSGEWVVNLDGDDHLTDKHFISYAVSLMRNTRNLNSVIFQGNHKIAKLIKIFKQYKQIDDESILVSGLDYFLNFYKIQSFTHLATFYDLNKAKELDFYSFDALATDVHSVLKLSLYGNVILSKRKVGVWQEHNDNESKKVNLKELSKNIESLQDLQKIAERKIGNEAARKWFKLTKNYYLLSFYHHMTQSRISFNQYLKIVTSFQFNKEFFYCLYHGFCSLLKR